MIEVSKISDFASNHFVAPFTGKNYEESIQRAKDWEKQNLGKVRLVAYFKQTFMGRSILVSYERINTDGN